MPLVLIPQQFERAFRERCEVFVSQATELAKQMREATKRAWFGPPKKGEKRIGADATAFLGNAFWQNTERAFYQIVDEMTDHVDDAEVWAKSAEKWRDRIIEETRDLFDRCALAQQEDGLNMRRVVDARSHLEAVIRKVHKSFTNIIQSK